MEQRTAQEHNIKNINNQTIDPQSLKMFSVATDHVTDPFHRTSPATQLHNTNQACNQNHFSNVNPEFSNNNYPNSHTTMNSNNNHYPPQHNPMPNYIRQEYPLPPNQATSNNTYTNNFSSPYSSNTPTANNPTYQYSPQKTAPNNSPRKTNNKKESYNNEKFILLALLSSIIITSLIIGIGWALFSPKDVTPTLTQATTKKTTETTIHNTPDNELSQNEQTKDIKIIYGTNTSQASNKDTQKNITETKPIKKSEPPIVKNPEVTSTTVANNTDKSTPTIPVIKSPISVAPPTISNNTQYWIQIFSTTNRDRANQIKKEFATQGITPSIVTKTINQTIYFRLRIGPYNNKNEGNKFLSWIRKNDNYKDAFISVANGG